MKILLMCANGLSTGILMNKMNQWAEQNNEDLEVKAIPIDDYLSVYKDYDVLLVGPQMRYKIKDVQKAVTDRPSAVINPSDYNSLKKEVPFFTRLFINLTPLSQ